VKPFGNSLYGGEETEWHDQLDEIRSIHAIVDDLSKYLYHAAFDVHFAARAYRACELLRLRLNPVLDSNQQRTMLAERMRKTDALMVEVRPLLEKELAAARREQEINFRVPGASGELLAKLDDLFNRLNILKKRVGLGLRTRPVFSGADRIREALD